MSTKRSAVSKRLYSDEEEDSSGQGCSQEIVSTNSHVPLGNQSSGESKLWGIKCNYSADTVAQDCHAPGSDLVRTLEVRCPEEAGFPRMSSTASACNCHEGQACKCQCPCSSKRPLVKASAAPSNNVAAHATSVPSSAAPSAAIIPVTPLVRRQSADPVVEELGSRAKSWWPMLSEGGARRQGDILARTPTVAAAPKGIHGYQHKSPQTSSEFSAPVQTAVDDAPPGSSTPIIVVRTASKSLRVRHLSSTKRPRQQSQPGHSSASIIIDSDEDDSDDPVLRASPSLNQRVSTRHMSLADLKVQGGIQTAARPKHPASNQRPSRAKYSMSECASMRRASLAASTIADSSSSEGGDAPQGSSLHGSFVSGRSSVPHSSSAFGASPRRLIHGGGPPPKAATIPTDDGVSSEEEFWSDAGSGSQMTYTSASRHSTFSPRGRSTFSPKGTIRRDLKQQFRTPYNSVAGTAQASSELRSQTKGESFVMIYFSHTT